MLILPSPPFRRSKRRVVRAGNQIVRVMHDTTTNRLLVYVNGMLGDLNFSQAMQAFSGGVWRSSTGGNFDSLPKVLVSFGVNISTANSWRIIDPSVWVFADGKPLMPPFEGDIG